MPKALRNIVLDFGQSALSWSLSQGWNSLIHVSYLNWILNSEGTLTDLENMSTINLDLEFLTDINSITETSNALLFESLMEKLCTTLKVENPAYLIIFSIDILGI